MQWKINKGWQSWFKREINGLVSTLIWLLVVTLLRWHWQWDLAWLWLGGLSGIFFINLDHLFYILAYPEQLTSLRIKDALKNRDFKGAGGLLGDTVQERPRLAFHNALFQAAFYLFCLFVLTSTENLFGVGLVMSMAWQLLREELTCLFKGQEEKLRNWLFWPIKRKISFKEQQVFVILMLLLFLGLNLFLI